MSSPDVLVVGLYFAVLVGLSVYGAHRGYLLYLYTNGANARRPAPPGPGGGSLPSPLPRVTVQLPIFNEVHVVERLIEAVAHLRYPRDRFEVQVLDDSTDETSRVARAAAQRWRARGLSISHHRRPRRTGFKAGALAEGLRLAGGELVAVFDADFTPPSDFLERAVGVFADPRIGMVQARWGHANRGHSLLTRLQALLLDGHFVLEHGGRHRGGCFFNFNGAAGIWRRAAIESAGGWQHDTLTEDLDLSYRAQLAGWRFVFLPDVVAPAELPVEMSAFKSQQHRWAKGSIQTCRKVLPAVLRSDAPLRVKAEAFLHLTANFNYLLVLALCALILPALMARTATGGAQRLLFVDAAVFGLAAVSIVTFHAVSQREIGGRWWARLADLPAMVALGLGLSVNNAVAVVEALWGPTGEFRRTPKYGVTTVPGGPAGEAGDAAERSGRAAGAAPVSGGLAEGAGDIAERSGRSAGAAIAPGSESNRSRSRAGARGSWAGAWRLALVEIGCGAWCALAAVHAVTAGAYFLVPFLALFPVGFFYAGFASRPPRYAAGPAEREGMP